MPDQSDDLTVKKYFDLEKNILDIVEDLYCHIDLSTGKLISIDYWYDYEGRVPETERYCEVPPDVKTEIDKLYEEYHKLADTPEVKLYQEIERQELRKQRKQWLQRFQEKSRACSSKAGNPEAFRRCRAQHLSEL